MVGGPCSAFGKQDGVVPFVLNGLRAAYADVGTEYLCLVYLHAIALKIYKVYALTFVCLGAQVSFEMSAAMLKQG